MLVTGTADKTNLLVIPENEVELLSRTPVELANQHLILLQETVKF